MKKAINYKLWNNVTGAFVFLVSAFIYFSTMEPTVSFWDCGEFLSCDANLEIAHPSGAPMVMLIRHVLSLLAGSNRSHITLIVNGTSAIASALTIMFLFWTITWFGRKILSSTWEGSNRQKILILAAGFIGAMAYAVSDSFWFSAVEAEVYAMSSLFTALVFWLMLKWEEVADNPGSERWLMLIAYIGGLSIGVHLLNLLAIPAIVILYYLKTYNVNWKNSIKAIVIAGLILGSILYIIIPGTPVYFSWFELLTVNSWGLPFNSGFLIGGIVLVGVFGLGLYISHKKKKIWLYNSIIYVALIILGFSSYAAVVIRSHDNPPVDMGNPEDPFSLENYLNREQYGQRPFFYGPSFASPVIDSKERKSYQRFRGAYVTYPLNPTTIYDPNTQMLFPRMASERPEHAEAYKEWTNFRGKPYYRTSEDGKQERIMLPTFGENMTFFFRYQLGFMYMRYFLWNFVGRQNDIQGHNTVLYGNWISGIPFIDKIFLGPQDKFPASLKHNPGRNVYYFLPFLLGLIGLVYQYNKDIRNFSVLGLLFFFTGIAIVIFLNEEPVTPRERDYVYVGSFYAFCVWIGIGVIALAQWFEKTTKLKDKIAVPLAIVLSLSVPFIMTTQNWDDHDRSGRYAVLEYARNYLESCEPNAILFTNADNDTYPLWYAEEVEGIRRDVRIVLLPYLSAPWYVDQLRKPIYDEPGLNISLQEDKFIGGQRAYLPIVDRVDSIKELNILLQFAGSEEPWSKVQLMDGQAVNFVPSHKWIFPVDKSKATVKPMDHWPMEKTIDIALRGNYLRMDQLVLLDILASNNWKRPVYFASIQEPRTYGLDKYLQLDGYAYKLTPYKSNPQDIQEVGMTTINSEALYDKYMNRFDFTSLANPKVYLDWTHVYTISIVGLREKFARLAEILLSEGKKDKAIKVLDKITTMLPHERVPYNYEILEIINAYFLAGQKSKGEDLLRKLENISKENLQYFRVLKTEELGGVGYETKVNLIVMRELAGIAERNHLGNISKEIIDYLNNMDPRLLQYLQQQQ